MLCRPSSMPARTTMSNLYPFQVRGREFLVENRRAYLGDGCGLGKTVQAAVAARVVRPSSSLVICPASAKENWAREWDKWGPPSQLVTTSYAALKGMSFLGDEWDLVILDEAHYVKNPKAKRSLAALNIARQANRAWLLSATPAPNDPGELWTVVKALWPEIAHDLGIHSYNEWFDRFNYWHMTEFGKRSHGAKNAPMLREVLRKIMLRRKLKDVELELPPLRVDVSLLPRDRRFTKTMEGLGLDAALDKMEAEEESDEQSMARLRRLLGEYKAPIIANIIHEELGQQQYDKVVILCHHLSVIDMMRIRLENYGVVGFTGSTSPPKRQVAIDKFTNDPDTRVFLAQQSAAGIAINLQSAAEVVLVEPSWVPDDNYQAMMRIHRIGQLRPCRARIFAVAGSLDEPIMDTVARKMKTQADIGL